MKVSIVMPTLNSAATIEKCLSSIRANKTSYDYEIIVVDGGSRDGTAEIARKYADKVLVEETFYPGINRNKGIKVAEGDIICFTESDCVVPPNWIEELVGGLLRLHGRDRRIVGVGGGNLPLLDENPSLMEQAISLVIRSPLVSFRARNLALFREEREVPHNPPLNAALFKWAFEEVGGYTEEYGYPGEDVELDAELTRRGYKLYYLPNVLVYHKHRSTFRRFIRQMFGYGKARVRVGRRFRRYFEFQHYGPIVLTLMTFSPLFFIPMAMSLVNGLLICFRARKPLLFPLAMLLTWSFYVSYGLGEITQFLKGR